MIARIYEVFPLVCPLCGGNMRLIGFITEGVQIRRILEHSGVPAQAPRVAPARGPPLWDDCDAQGAEGAGQGARTEPDWGESSQMTPDASGPGDAQCSSRPPSCAGKVEVLRIAMGAISGLMGLNCLSSALTGP